MFDCTRVGTPEPVSEQKVPDGFDEIHWADGSEGRRNKVHESTRWANDISEVKPLLSPECVFKKKKEEL